MALMIYYRFLYILMPQVTSVGAFRLDGPGKATLVQTVNVTVPVTAAGYEVGMSLTLSAALSPYAVFQMVPSSLVWLYMHCNTFSPHLHDLFIVSLPGIIQYRGRETAFSRQRVDQADMS